MGIRTRTLAAFAALSFVVSGLATAQTGSAPKPWTGAMGIRQTVAEIMERERTRYPGELGNVLRDMEAPPLRPEKEGYERRGLPDAPGAPRVSQWPPQRQSLTGVNPVLLGRGNESGPYAVGTSFIGPIFNESFAVPPDSMGDVGPTQILTAVNNRIKVYDKFGVLGPLNADIDTFFDPVRNGVGTSDPRVKFDRLSNRWYVVIINLTAPNRVLLAVSSGPTITGAASFTFFQFQQDMVGATPNVNTGEFCDYPTLGIDNNALYIGGNMFNAAGTSFQGCTGFVVRKSSVTGAGPIVATAFREIVPPSGATGPYTPQGVDNDDAAATEGYFIGVDAGVFNRLVMRRVSDPGGAPTISGDLLITVPTTRFPINTPCLGSTAPLDSLEDRLFSAKIFFNRLTGTRTLWTSHSFEVNSAGVGTTGGGRNGSRWYQISNLAGAPTLTQSGTVFSSAATSPSSFWIPSMAMNMQGHAVLACSNAGAAQRAEIAMAQRFSSDALGTMQAPLVIQTSATNYNLQAGEQRWGDYSHTVVDPTDGMTVWTFQEYCNANNSWALRVTQLRAPLPATISSVSQPNLAIGASNFNVTVTGTSVSGSGFFDPGAGFSNRIGATVSGAGVTVNSVTFTNPTSITLNLTVASNAPTGARNLTVFNPDGQTSVLNGAFTVVNPVPTISLLSPNNALAGGPQFTLTVTGTNFVPTSVVRWNGVNLTTTFGSSTQLTADVPAANIASPGTANVDVMTPAPGGGTSSTLPFTINPGGATIINPDAYTVLLGTDRTPNLAALFLSDDTRIQINAPVTDYQNLVEIHGVSPLQSVARLSFILESSCNLADRVRHIEMLNHGTGLWEDVGSTPNPLTDGTTQVDITSNPNRFIKNGTRELLTRVRVIQTNSRPSLKKQLDLIDRAVWEILP